MSVRSSLRLLVLASAFLPTSTLLLSPQLPTLSSFGAAETRVTRATTDVRADAFDSVIGNAPLKKEDGEGQSADGPDCALTEPWSLRARRCSVAFVAEHRPLGRGHSVSRHAARGPPLA